MREISRGTLDLSLMHILEIFTLENLSGVRKFLFICEEVREQKKGWEPLGPSIIRLFQCKFCSQYFGVVAWPPSSQSNTLQMKWN